MNNILSGRVALPHATDAPDLAELLCVARQSKDNGWPVIPLAFRNKGHIPAGLTGYNGRDASWRQIRHFIEHGFWTGQGAARQHHDCGGLAYRMPQGVIGIDVDAYKPEGLATLRALEREHGPLPPTYRSTSRGGRSGIYFYRVPVGMAYAANPGDGIEVIQRHHRYAIVYPSIHEKTGSPYRWIDPGGHEFTGPGPDVSDLTWLPGADDDEG